MRISVREDVTHLLVFAIFDISAKSPFTDSRKFLAVVLYFPCIFLSWLLKTRNEETSILIFTAQFFAECSSASRSIGYTGFSTDFCGCAGARQRTRPRWVKGSKSRIQGSNPVLKKLFPGTAPPLAPDASDSGEGEGILIIAMLLLVFDL